MCVFSKLVYEELAGRLGNNGCLSLRPLYFDAPIQLGAEKMSEVENKREGINAFLSRVAYIGKTALENHDESLLKLLFSEAPVGMNWTYHEELPDCCWNTPFLYRTDESLSGKIYEIQAPGSGWGDLYLFAKCYESIGYRVPQTLLDFPKIYASAIKKYTGCRRPRVYHMLDAASVPYNMRYLMSLSDELAYWGIDGSVKMRDVDFVVSHSVASLVASNFFASYLEKERKGELLFSTQPNILFDEKAIYLLPFYRKTRDCFSDDVRKLFPFTSVIENGGFFDEQDVFVHLDEFVKRPKEERRFFLKYGGPDTNRNWGSRSVYRLNGNDCEALLGMAKKKSENGEVWLLQRDCSMNDDTFYSEDISRIRNNKLYVKLSSFYGKDILFGVKIMARKHFKVHGQDDTYTGIGV